MKVFIDTNVLISAMLYKNGAASLAYEKMVKEYECYISNNTISELRNVFNKKFKDKINMLEVFIMMTLKTIKLIEDVNISYPLEKTIRDPKDVYIYRNAKYLNCDMIVSGDKDFLENTQLDIEIKSISEVLKMFDD